MVHCPSRARKLAGKTVRNQDMAEPRSITVYSDYKSPYAYLAKDKVRALEREIPMRVTWLPYILDIPSYLGSAKVDESGSVLEEQRNAHQWRRVRYSYMDSMQA